MKGRLSGGLAGLFLIVVVWSCIDNPYDNIPEALNITYSITQMSDSLSAYCFYPINLAINVSHHERIYIDSILFRMSETLAFEKVNNYQVDFSYSTVGTHFATVRYYFTKDAGVYTDTTFIFTSAINYHGEAINEILENDGSFVNLKPFGHKHNSVLWHWDLSRVGVGIVTSEGDTAVFINRDVLDTVYLSQVDDAGRRSPYIAVPFTAHRAGVVPFTLSRIGPDLNNYSFFPITFTAIPHQADRAIIDSIILYVPEGTREYTYRLTPDNNYAATFNYADTGVHVGIMRVYNARGEMSFYDTLFTARVGADFRVESNKYMIDDTGGVVTLRAGGNRAGGVSWEWNMTRIFNGTVRTMADTVAATILRQNVNISDTVYLRQVMSDTVNGISRARSTHSVPHFFAPELKMYAIKIEQ